MPYGQLLKAYNLHYAYCVSAPIYDSDLYFFADFKLLIREAMSSVSPFGILWTKDSKHNVYR